MRVHKYILQGGIVPVKVLLDSGHLWTHMRPIQLRSLSLWDNLRI